MRLGLFPVLLLLITGIRSVGADDTELYVNSVLASKPNVVIIYGNSRSMCSNTILNPPNAPENLECGVPEADDNLSRDEISRAAIIRFITRLTHANVSVLSFNEGTRVLSPGEEITVGGRVRFASADINTDRSLLISEFNNNIKANHHTSTPLVGTLYEALRYLAGEPPIFGRGYRDSDGQNHEPSVSGSMDQEGQYNSPITHQCQGTFIVVFTDAESHDNFDREQFYYQSQLSRYPLYRISPDIPQDLDFIDCDPEDGSSDASCLDELGWYAHNHDLNISIAGDQSATIYAIGAFIHSDDTPVSYLEALARHGGGESFSVFDETSLDDALETIRTSIAQRTSISQQNTTLTAPAISLSAFNSLEHSEEIYYALFQPAGGPAWRGNLKRYRLGADNKIYDADGQLAIDPATGFFSDTARSFWSSAADGAEVGSGGAAEQLGNLRRWYVTTNATGSTNVDLSDFANVLYEGNSRITLEMLGARDQDEAETILKWAKGLDLYDEDGNNDVIDTRNYMGDPLHTRPQVITYYKGYRRGLPVVDRTLYLTTNDGFLHAINTDNGRAEFSFIPVDLLGNLKIYHDGFADDGRTKIYGMDGPMTSWVYDKNGDGDLLNSNNGDADDGEHAYLYLTMRRGGNNIYALDVTDRTRPKLKWVIRGDTNNDNVRDSLGEFRHLGQTWSRVKPATVKWNGKDQAVLFFGGGYDIDIDNHPEIPNGRSNIGNAVYMVDAERGSLLWSAGQRYGVGGIDMHVHGMVFSIPAELSLVDYDSDGVTDYFFAVDTGGQIFRFDINDGNTGAADFATGGRIARLAGVNDPSTARRFFQAPVVAFSKDYDAINIAVGSGYRPSPLSTATQDRFYVIRDVHVDRVPSSYDYASGGYIKAEDHLYDATDNLIQDGIAFEQMDAQKALDSKHGWYINLEGSGEKVLNKASIYGGVLSFTTFTPAPPPTVANSCSSGEHTNNLYVVNIENGSSVINFVDSTATLDKAHRRVRLSQTGIAPEPSILIKSEQGGEFCVGTECFQGALQDVQGLPAILRGGWRENR